MLKLLLLASMVPAIVAAELSVAPPEDHDWQRFIREGKTTYDQVMRSNQAVIELEARIAGLVSECRSRLDKDASKLLDESEVDWKKWARAQADFIADQYRGGSLEGVKWGMEYIKSLVLHISDLKSYEEDYFAP